MIEVEDGNGLRTVTIARPEKANSLTSGMLADLAAAVAGWEGAALVLTGAGRVFSAGADLDEVRGGGLAAHPGWERLSAAVAAFPGLAIAALNGTAAGGALGMVLACDLRIAVPEAEIFYPVMRMGVVPPAPDPGRLAALAGPARAARLLLAGERVGAGTALDWGLVDRIAAPEALLATARDLAAPALAAGPERVAAIKALIRRRG